MGDELVASLLVLHDLHPKDTETRVVEALDQVRPYLGSHAGGVELLGVDPEAGVVRLRLEGSCDGCPSSTMTVKLAIERAIEQAAPEVTAVEVENLTREKEPQLLQIQPLRREWEVVEGLDGLEPGRLTAVEVAGAGVVVCSVGGELYAYRDRCPACGAGLAGAAALDAEVLACGPAGSASTSGWPAAGSTAPSCTWSRCPCWPATAGSAWPSGREPVHEPSGPAAVRGAAARAGAGPGGRP